ncbi:MAG: divalent-cation tolerance protein CutA [Rhodomicrobium sp.]|nr:divalent-cation tolerance protein CutA [Rhodomicrobium sp.]
MEQAGGMIIIYTTLPSESDARKLGGELVEQRLAACVNILPGMVSVYRWQDAIETANEAAMLVKTRTDLEAQVLEAIAAKHPYTVPALFAFEPHRTAASYLEWLYNQTTPQR